MAILRLVFEGSNHIELVATSCGYSKLEAPIKAVRGKTSGVDRGVGTFQWTSAVQAFSILAMMHALGDASGIEGGVGSLAASLDYAITKQPLWLMDMFGVEKGGHSRALRLFHRSNPGRRRPGPVRVSLNYAAIAPKDVEIFLKRTRVEEGRLIELLHSLKRDLGYHEKAESYDSLLDFLDVLVA